MYIVEAGSVVYSVNADREFMHQPLVGILHLLVERRKVWLCMYHIGLHGYNHGQPLMINAHI